MFSDIYTKENIKDFDDKHVKDMNRWLVYCTDLKELIRRIASFRDIDMEDAKIKAGFDDGKSKLILTLTVYDPNDVVPTGPFVKKKRATKPEDIHCHEAF